MFLRCIRRPGRWTEWDQEAAKQPLWRRVGTHRGADDVEQGLITVNADLSVGQPSHHGLQAPEALLQEVHGQDGCRHLHCPQPLTLGGDSQVSTGEPGLRVEGGGGRSCWEGDTRRALLPTGRGRHVWRGGRRCSLGATPCR